MKLLFLHGAPAAGKLTVAKAVLELVPGRLFDNHVTVDLARTLFEFGAPGFWDLVHNIRCEAFAAAAEHGKSDQISGRQQLHRGAAPGCS